MRKLYFQTQDNKKQDLPDSLAWIESLFAATPIGLAVFDPDLRILWINRTLAETGGRTVAEHAGRSLREVRPELADPLESLLRQVLAGRETGNIEISCPIAGGGAARWLVSGLPVRGARDEVEAVLAVFVDVTGRERTETPLRESETLYRSLAANLPGGAAFVVDRDLRYVLAEGQALREAGMTPADLEGRTLREALPPDLADRYEPHYRQVLAGASFRWEHESHGRHYVSHGLPLRDDRGEIHAALAVSYDITERRRVEEALRASEERVRLALAAAHAGVWEFDPATETNHWSPENFGLFGLNPTDGMPGYKDWLARCIHPEDRDALDLGYRAARAPGGPAELTLEFRIVHPERGVRWISAPTRIERNADGSVRRVLGLNIDITPRKQTEDALRQSAMLAMSRANEIEAIYDGAPIGIVLFDRDFRFARINERLARINARSIAEHLGRPIEEVLPAGTVAVLRAIQPRLLAGEEVSDLEIGGPDPATGAHGTFLVSYRPLMDDERQVRWILGTVLDITARKDAEAALLERTREAAAAERLLDALMRYVPAGLTIATAPDVEIVRVSDYGSRLLGRPRAELEHITVERHPDAYRVFHADSGAAAKPEELPLTRAVKNGELVVNEEWLVANAQGERIPILCNAGPIQDADGLVVGGVIAWRDITELKRATEHQRLLISELNHRVKNMLSTVQSIAAQTLRGSAAETGVREAFEARLLGLAGAHDLLTRDRWQGAELSDVVLQALKPFGCLQTGASTRFEIGGSDVRLPPKAALAFSMAFHELATNAAKYGALSSASGRVAVAWRVVPGPDGDRLRLLWEESGGPPVEKPSRRGFGSRMIERGLAQELDGEVTLDYAPSGVVCRMDLPMPGRRPA
jgi:PAS domain S-box-containing protein